MLALPLSRSGRAPRGLCGLIGLALVVLAGCSPSSGGPAAPAAAPATVTVLQVAPERVVPTDELPGRVTALRTAQIRPQVSGIVLKRLFEQGAEVKAGQPLFQIDPATFRTDVAAAAAALQRMEATLQQAQRQVARLEPLLAADAVSRQTYDDTVAQRDQARAQVAEAQAALDRKRLDLQYTTVSAPIGGRIEQVLVTEGALVTAADANPMTLVQQVDRVYVDVRQPASAADPSQRATALPVTVFDGQGRPYPQPGRLLFSGQSVDATSGDVLLRIEVPNPQRTLLPGLYVRARVPAAPLDAALLVPQQAVQRAADGAASLWIVDPQGHAKQIPVGLGRLVERRYVVAHGLRGGDRVVIEGQERLQDGAAVKAVAWGGVAAAATPASASASASVNP